MLHEGDQALLDLAQNRNILQWVRLQDQDTGNAPFPDTA